ncbi:Bulb-type lectin domain containing protein [Trema orientale]|uniref:Bulb-type lectin domain containing protein n=1 Tax=Trema orientale TaxID=63057 RepID=A0A2P5FU36_TREOI|nr:Bulb-type lectin domain containing protein [Trema orientale]
MAPSSQLVLLPLFLLIQLPDFVFSQTNNGNVKFGASLFAEKNSSPWLSASGDFAFGFRQLRNQDDLFLLCIWYAKIPDKTIIWCANGNKPAAVKSNVVLTPEIGLALTSPQGEELWKSVSIDGQIAGAVMSDEGNFAIVDSRSEKLWETFKNPTDTILPSQILDRESFLSSRQSEANYSKGRFQFRLQQDGNLVLNTINLPSDFANEPYYESNTTSDTSNSVTAGNQLVFNESGYLYILRENGERFNLTTQGERVSTKDNYFRATLSFDGVFTQYFHPKSFSGNVSWKSLKG